MQTAEMTKGREREPEYLLSVGDVLSPTASGQEPCPGSPILRISEIATHLDNKIYSFNIGSCKLT